MISRRHLLAALAAIPALPVRVFGQDAPGRGQQRDQPRDTTPLVPPFESTGWKTVWLDHLNYQCVDYRKAAAFYATLMGWKVRSDDGKQAVLDIGVLGNMYDRLRFGYVRDMIHGLPGVLWPPWVVRLIPVTWQPPNNNGKIEVFPWIFNIADSLLCVGVVAMILATAGVYALMSFTVARRTSEIGIRVALGADPRRIITSTFARAFTQVTIGLVLGGIPAAAIVAAVGPEVAATNGGEVAIWTCLVSLAIVAMVTAIACVLPARRALRIQPTDALKTT